MILFLAGLGTGLGLGMVLLWAVSEIAKRCPPRLFDPLTDDDL